VEIRRRARWTSSRESNDEPSGPAECNVQSSTPFLLPGGSQSAVSRGATETAETEKPLLPIVLRGSA
jgi:hypothetical protein